jgi:hypothetical protein
MNNLIAERAYFIYLNRIAKGIFGDANSDWFQAQDELIYYYQECC